jgi:hypothetical protein
MQRHHLVGPAKAGIQGEKLRSLARLGPRFRGGDIFEAT